MNILVGAPNENFNLNRMRKKMLAHPGLKKEQLFFADQPLTAEQLASIDVIVGYDAKLVPQIVNDPNSHLKWIQSLSVGIDYFPLDAIKKRGILLTTVNGIHVEPIAETVMGMLFGQFRNLNRIARIRKWQKPTTPFKLLADKKAVLFGTGNIGKRIAEILQVFNVTCVGVNHSGREVKNFVKTVPMDQVGTQPIDADIIINSLPLTSDTEGYFNQAFFNQLTNQPLFVNVGRGGSVVTADLIAALQNGRVGAASLDVVDPEPLAADSPLWGMDNVFISTHIASLFDQYGEASLAIFSENLRQYEYDGTLPINQVNFK